MRASPPVAPAGTAGTARQRRHRRIAGLGGLLLAALLVAGGQPWLVLALPGAAALVAVAVLRPMWLLCAAVLTLIVIPTYIRFKLLPGLPPLPVALALLALLGATLLLAGLLGERRMAPLGADGRRMVAAMTCFSAALAVTLFDARTGVNSVDFWIKIVAVPGLLCFAMLRLLRSAHDLRLVFLMLVAGALIAALYAVAEFVAGTNVILQYFQGQGDEADWYWEGVDFAAAGQLQRTYSLLTNPIEFGALLSMVLPYTLLRLMDSPPGRARLGWLLSSALLLVGITLSFSRGPMLAVALTTLWLAWIFPTLRRWLAGGLLAALLALAAAWPWVGERISDRVTDAGNVTLRLKLWSIALHMAADHPLLGVGLGNFPAYQMQTLDRHRISVLGEPNAVRVQTTENLYLQFAAETGVLGLIGLAGLAWTCLRLARRLARHLPAGEERLLLHASVAGVAAYAVNGLTVVSYQLYVITVTCGFMFGVLLVLDRSVHAAADRADGTGPHARPGGPDASGRGGSAPGRCQAPVLERSVRSDLP